ALEHDDRSGIVHETAGRRPPAAVRARESVRVGEVGRRLLATITGDLVADLLPLAQRPHAGALDRPDVHEQILAAALRRDEAVSFLRVERFYRTNCHIVLQVELCRHATQRGGSTVDKGRKRGPALAAERNGPDRTERVDKKIIIV